MASGSYPSSHNLWASTRNTSLSVCVVGLAIPIGLTSTSFKKTSNHLRLDNILFIIILVSGDGMLRLQSSETIAANGSYLEFHDRGVAIC